LRRLRIVAPVQLPLDLGGNVPTPAQRWSLLSEPARQGVLVLLARLIARGVVDEEAPAHE
jgi:hypothetical protein